MKKIAFLVIAVISLFCLTIPVFALCISASPNVCFGKAQACHPDANSYFRGTGDTWAYAAVFLDGDGPALDEDYYECGGDPGSGGVGTQSVPCDQTTVGSGAWFAYCDAFAY